MKLRKHLSKVEAELIGLEAKPTEEYKNKRIRPARYTITKNDFNIILRFRNTGVVDSCESLEVDPTTVKHLWKKTKQESIFVKNPLYVEQQTKQIDDLKEYFTNELSKYSPKIPKIKRKIQKEGHLLVVDIADLHINKPHEVRHKIQSYIG